MKKRLLLVVLAVIAAMACALFVGCTDDSGAGESASVSASETQKESVEKEEATISLDKKDLVVDMYDEAELYAVVKNSDEAVVWTSDNPSVATVSEGIVKGVAEGETVIRASVADKTAACNVTIVKSSELPVLKLEYSEMNLYSGDVIDFEVFAKWKNKKVENAVYEWAVKTGGDVVSVENGDENGIFTLTALKAGTAEYTVSATAVGATVYADVKFTVVMPDYALEIKNFTLTESGYEYTLWRKTGEETPVTAETVVKRAGKEIDYAVISWKSSNEAVAIAENGVITGKTDGKAVITATVSGRGIEPFSTEIDLTVKEEIYRKVAYYDSDKTTVLYEESVLDGTAAKYVRNVYPAESDLDDGYKAFYDRCDWVNENGRAVSLEEVTSDLNVYAAYGYIAYKHYEFTAAASDNTVFNGPFANQNKYAKIADGKLAMSFRAYADNTQVALMELVNWSTPLTMNCQKDVWYTFVIEFENDETGAQEYTGVKAYILDESGNVIKQAAASLYDERTWAFAKLPYTTDENGAVIYGTECKIDVGVPMTGIKNSYTVTYYDVDGTTVLYTEKVEEGDKAVYAAPSENLEDGYVETYFNATWVTAHGGTEAADLTAVTENKSVYLSGEKVIVKSYEYARQDANGGGLMNKPANIHKYAAIKDGKMEFYIMPHQAYAKVGLMELVGWSAPMQVYLPTADVWYKFVITFGDEITCSAYNADGSILDGKENVSLTGFETDNFWLLVYTQITDWSTPAFADSGSCEIAVKA